MKNGAHVLIVCRDEMLLRTREMLLGSFFNVQGAGRATDAKDLIAKSHFELIVLCHSLSEDECRQLAVLAQEQYPRPKILAMNATGVNPSNSWADMQLGVDEGPYVLIKKCAEMLGYTMKSKAKAAHV
jgi:NAD(P)-dependent dehydrogenase (short-subunit alcohol dehydrogenase family)